MSIDETWSYEESLYYIEYIKRYFDCVTLSFSMFGGNKEYFEKIRKLKRQIYGLKFEEEWKKDKLWEYICGDITYDDLLSFV